MYLIYWTNCSIMMTICLFINKIATCTKTKRILLNKVLRKCIFRSKMTYPNGYETI